MDTINIINNFDQKILMENVLIMNQLKLLNICKNMETKQLIPIQITTQQI